MSITRNFLTLSTLKESEHSMAFILLAGALAGALYYINEETVNLYQRYVKIKGEGGAGLYPVAFQRPPTEIWQTIGDLYAQPGMPEGQGAVLPVNATFNDQGIFGAPKTNFLKDNR